MRKKDIQLNVADNVLTIRGEKKNEREETKKELSSRQAQLWFVHPSRPAAGSGQRRQHQGGDVQRRIEGNGAEAGAGSNQEDRHQGGGLIADGKCAAAVSGAL